MVSAPRPPTRSEGIHSPLQRGGDGGGAVSLVAGGRGTETPVLLEVCSVYLAGVAARYLLFFSL